MKKFLLITILLVCMSACLYVCMSDLSVCLSVCLPVCLSVCLSFCLSVYLSVCRSVLLSVCPSVCLSVCLSVCEYRTLWLGIIRPQECGQSLTTHCNKNKDSPFQISNTIHYLFYGPIIFREKKYLPPQNIIKI